MSQEKIKLKSGISKESCEEIANAILDRWIASDIDHDKVMELVFKTDAATAVADMTSDFLDITQENQGFFYDLMLDLQKPLAIELNKLYEDFIRDYRETYEGWIDEQWKNSEEYAGDYA